MFEFVIGFVVGAVVLVCTLLPMIYRWRAEHEAMADALDMTHDRMRSNEKSRAVAQRQFLATHKKLEEAQGETERLRQEKLNAWDIPESY